MVLRGTSAIRDSFSLSQNNLTVSAADKRMFNPPSTHYHASPWINADISGVHADAWGYFEVDYYRDRCVQAGLVRTWIPSYTYFRSRVADGSWTASGSAPRMPLCLEAMKAVREGACVSASNVSCAMESRLLTLNSPVGG